MSLECASANWHPQAQPLESAGGPPAVALAPQQPAQAPPAAPASATPHAWPTRTEAAPSAVPPSQSLGQDVVGTPSPTDTRVVAPCSTHAASAAGTPVPPAQGGFRPVQEGGTLQARGQLIGVQGSTASVYSNGFKLRVLDGYNWRKYGKAVICGGGRRHRM